MKEEGRGGSRRGHDGSMVTSGLDPGLGETPLQQLQGLPVPSAQHLYVV